MHRHQRTLLETNFPAVGHEPMLIQEFIKLWSNLSLYYVVFMLAVQIQTNWSRVETIGCHPWCSKRIVIIITMIMMIIIIIITTTKRFTFTDIATCQLQKSEPSKGWPWRLPCLWRCPWQELRSWWGRCVDQTNVDPYFQMETVLPFRNC